MEEGDDDDLIVLPPPPKKVLEIVDIDSCGENDEEAGASIPGIFILYLIHKIYLVGLLLINYL